MGASVRQRTTYIAPQKGRNGTKDGLVDIGDACGHGIMHGEVVEAAREEPEKILIS
jgi:hypothetical protein